MRNLGFAYARLPVLGGIEAEAQPGRITAVLGPNAVGKSTLLRCAIGLLRPDEGDVLLGGKLAHRLRARELAALAAYVPQRSIVSAAFTVREVVRLGRYAVGRSERRVEEAITTMELTAIAERPYPALSVGQQQRVALARALAQVPERGILILDEPTSAMDMRRARNCFSVLRRLADEGATVLMAMHDLPAAAALADDVWLLAAGAPGHLAASGPVEQVMRGDRLERVFGVGFEWARRGDGSRVLLPETRIDASSTTM
ncbi:MAG: ABC transporter ATP-binding protein [Planctomycetota bacterium]|nr:ABC transporter ATP-binding protein [Planctomycetota bacterium]